MLQLIAPQIVHIIPDFPAEQWEAWLAQPFMYLMKAQGSGSANLLKHHTLAVNKFDLAFEVQEPFVLWNDALKPEIWIFKI